MQGGRLVVLSVIKQNLSQGHRLSTILSAFKVPLRTYYDWINYSSSQRYNRRKKLISLVRAIWKKHPEYGYVRIAKVIQHTFKLKLSNRTVWSSMSELGIQSVMYRKHTHKPTTVTEQPQLPNLMRKLDDLSGIVTTDITYVQLKSARWAYVATAYNPETRQVLAFQVSDHMTAELATEPIKQLIALHYPFTMVHSDMGSQYTSDLFEKTLAQDNLAHSYSRKGRPADNGRLESYHSLLKKERTNHHVYTSITDLRHDLIAYNHFYNTTRETNGRGSYHQPQYDTA